MASFALVQERLDRIPIDMLAAALAGIPGLAALDATHLARYAFGILIERQPLAVVERLQERLAGAGCPVHVALQSDIPEVPPTQRVSHADVADGQLEIREAAGPLHVLKPDDVLVLSFGMVRHVEAEALFEPRTKVRYIGVANDAIAIPRLTQLRVGTAYHDRILLEVLTREANYEMKVPPELGPVALIGRLAAFAPAAEQTAGTAATLELGNVIPVYPSLHAYHNEIRWRLYRAHKAERGRLPAT